MSLSIEQPESAQAAESVFISRVRLIGRRQGLCSVLRFRMPENCKRKQVKTADLHRFSRKTTRFAEFTPRAYQPTLHLLGYEEEEICQQPDQEERKRGCRSPLRRCCCCSLQRPRHRLPLRRTPDCRK